MSSAVSSSRRRPEAFAPWLPSASFGDLRLGMKGCSFWGVLAAMFFSEQVRPSKPSSSESGSIGVANVERGRLPLVLRGLGGASVTGDGDSEGSFSWLSARPRSSSSDIGSCACEGAFSLVGVKPADAIPMPTPLSILAALAAAWAIGRIS